MTARRVTEADVQAVAPTRAAELLDMDRHSVMALIHSHELPAAKFGGDGKGARYRIRLRDIDELLTARAA
jgi:excisionase family DNA binding protein